MPWADDVSAILEGYLSGQAGAGALADILYGRLNPSGKLAETFPHKLDDNPSHQYFPAGPSTVEYRESIFVGYRYYDSVQQDVLFPFGHGLSYTTFEYSDLKISQAKIDDKDTLSVTLTVKNTGSIAGKEIVQLYVRDVEATVFRPDKELKGFEKVALQPGEETQVVIELGPRAFAYYDAGASDWQIEEGTFDILVGASTQDIRLQASVEVTSSQPVDAVANDHTTGIYHNFPKGEAISRQDFESLLGRSVPANEDAKKGEYTINTPIADMNESLIGRQLNSYMNKQMIKMIGDQEGTPTTMLMQAIASEMPLRGILMMGEGSISREMLDSIVVLANGHLIKGIGGLIKAIREK